MRVIFKTNLDNYSSKMFPENLEQIPRKGDSISVIADYQTPLFNKGLPTTLEVVSVTWHMRYVICELHYSEFSIKSANISGVNLF